MANKAIRGSWLYVPTGISGRTFSEVADERAAETLVQAELRRQGGEGGYRLRAAYHITQMTALDVDTWTGEIDQEVSDALAFEVEQREKAELKRLAAKYPGELP